MVSATFRGRLFVPFAPTSAERLAIGDAPVPPSRKRYPTKDAYVAAIRAAAEVLITQRFLLPDDAKLLIGGSKPHKCALRQGDHVNRCHVGPARLENHPFVRAKACFTSRTQAPVSRSVPCIFAW